MAKIETEQLDIKVDKGTERAREKVFTSKDLGCHIKFQVKNVVCTMVLALGFFLVVTQHLLPLSGFDTKKIWCTETAKLDCVQQADIQLTQYDLLPQELLHEKVNKSLINLNNGVVRVFKPHGLATHLYIEMSAYRGGPRVFSIVGLTSKPTETYHKPPFACEWVSHSTVVKGLARKTLPDWNYGRLYTVVVITCTFAEDVGVRGEGGELILYASYGDQFRQPERIVALVESKGEYNASIFNPQNFPYDYVYCGSPVFGDISPQRIREWMAYHAKFFGEKSHFILYDAGGYHRDVRKVLEPWIKQGRASLQNVRQQEIYDGYYHNQFLVVNDCLFRSRFMANWTFFFDIDEYMYVDPSKTLSSVLNMKPAKGKLEVTQVIIDQVPVANGMCVADNTTKAEHRSKWGIEKLVYRTVFKKGVHHDRKYAVQARHAEATGIHMSMNMRRGKHALLKRDQMRYYHYHGSINKRDDVCSIFVNPRNATAALDMTMSKVASGVKKYELKTIGTQPLII